MVGEAPGYVTARRAAELTGLNERTIRRMIARGDLPARKVAVNRYLIAATDLPPRKRNRLREELDTLHAELEAVRRRLSALEKPKMALEALRADSDGLRARDVLPLSPAPAWPSLPERGRVEPPPEMDASTDDHLPRVVDACRYLERHGVNVHTPKSWEWLKPALPITGADLLSRTVAHLAAAKWRASNVLLHKCTQEWCACQWALTPNCS